MRWLDIIIILMLITDHSEDLRYGVVHTFDVTTSVRVVGACREFLYVEGFLHSSCSLGAKLRSSVGQDGGPASPKRDVAVHQNVGGPFGGEVGCGNSEYVRLAAETIREEDIKRSSHGTTKDVGQGDREDLPANQFPGILRA